MTLFGRTLWLQRHVISRLRDSTGKDNSELPEPGLFFSFPFACMKAWKHGNMKNIVKNSTTTDLEHLVSTLKLPLRQTCSKHITLSLTQYEKHTSNGSQIRPASTGGTVLHRMAKKP